MDYLERTRSRIRLNIALSAILFVVLSGAVCRAAGTVLRGSISGTVKADQGEVRGFRVTAHNLQYKLWYTVFTNKGRYTIPQALPGLYDVTVLEPGYLSPALPVQLGPGENRTLDITVARQAPGAGEARPGYVPSESDFGESRSSAKTVFVDRLEDLYTPGPGLDLMKANCFGCHGASFGAMHMNKESYRIGISRMTETGPTDTPNSLNLGRTVLTGPQKDMIAEYLAKNFGPGEPTKRVRVDPPVIDEDVISKAIYVSYDTPPNMAIGPRGERIGANQVDGVVEQAGPVTNWANNYLHDPFIAPDGAIWYGAPVANAMMRLDKKELDPAKRWQTFPVKGTPYVFIHGITADSQGRMYWAEINGGQLGELDPATGKQIRHFTPERGAMLQVATDQSDNIWFGMVKGGHMGKLDAKTRRVYEWPTPTPDNGIYGLAVDPQGNVWGAGWQKGIATKFDPKTETYTEYMIPNSWGQLRRIGVDSKGIVWFSEYNVGRLGSLDPATGKISEFQLPTRGANPYDVWPDQQDNIWMGDQPQSSLVKFDRNTKKFTYYPEPQLRWSLPKIEIEKNNTIWFGARGLPHITANHFYPDGYTADAPPEP